MTGSVWIVMLALSTVAAACGTASNQADLPAASGAAGETSSSAGATGAPSAEAGAGGESVGTTTPEPEACKPTSKTDEPDEEFVDANCDGIDGDVKHAVFVSPDGFDSDDGGIKTPVQSIGQALELAKDGGLAVYVCNGTYRENVVVDTPVSIYGGYDCTRGWKRTKDVAVLQAGAGLPLLVKNVDGKVRLERLAFRAPAGVGPGQSSQAAAIVGSSDVTLDQVELKTGNGTAGMSGVNGANASSSPPKASAQGMSTSTVDCYAPGVGGTPDYPCDRYATGGYSATMTQSCAAGFQMRGGRGGAGGNAWLAKGKPGCMLRISDTGDDGLLGQYQTGDGNWHDVTAASSGAPGAEGADGAAPVFGVGSIVEGVYSATNRGADGAPGHPGWPGKGGAGGYSAGHNGDVCASDYRVGSGGGQGGLGGCGGGRATGGGAGGGAVALVITNSSVKIANARFVIGDGGDGGDGAPGGAPQLGASGAAGGNAQSTVYQGKQGQAGGNGGAGGDGAPGGGGPAIAVLYTGAIPEVTDAVYEIGAPGVGGQAFSGSSGPTGATGEVMSLDEILGTRP
jgi:hypothetical protein